jgi:hypothetical protein
MASVIIDRQRLVHLLGDVRHNHDENLDRVIRWLHGRNCTAAEAYSHLWRHGGLQYRTPEVEARVQQFWQQQHD